MNLTMLVKTLDSGQVEASVLEFPGCRIEASSRDIAIDQLRTTLIDRLQDSNSKFKLCNSGAWRLKPQLHKRSPPKVDSKRHDSPIWKS